MLNAMSQGNDGSLSTIHANSSMEVFNRIATYAIQAAERLPVEATHMLIAGCDRLRRLRAQAQRLPARRRPEPVDREHPGGHRRGRPGPVQRGLRAARRTARPARTRRSPAWTTWPTTATCPRPQAPVGLMVLVLTLLLGAVVGGGVCPPRPRGASACRNATRPSRRCSGAGERPRGHAPPGPRRRGRRPHPGPVALGRRGRGRSALLAAYWDRVAGDARGEKLGDRPAGGAGRPGPSRCATRSPGRSAWSRRSPRPPPTPVPRSAPR